MMTIDKLLVTFVGAGLVGFIWWFFFGKRDESSSVVSGSNGSIDVIVSGGYDPALIKVRKGQPTTFKILRKDSNTCLEEIIIPGFKVKEYLPLNKEVKVKITPRASGEFGFHCGMGMYHGKIVVSE